MRFIQFFRTLNLKILRQVIRSIGQQRLPGLAAEMAYSNLLALFPAIIALLTVIGSLDISQDKVEAVVRQWLQLAPEEVVLLLDKYLGQITLPQGGRVFSISFGITLWLASSALSVAMSVMDQIYQIPPSRVRPFWQAKLVSLILTAYAMGFVLIASFLVFISDFLVSFALNWMQLPPSGFLLLWNLFRWSLAFVILAFGFSMIYRYGPSRWPSGTPILPGAIIAALLWALISQGFRMYVAYFANFNLTYGALSAGILLLLWLNLSSLALLIGAQLNVTVGRAMRELQP